MLLVVSLPSTQLPLHLTHPCVCSCWFSHLAEVFPPVGPGLNPVCLFGGAFLVTPLEVIFPSSEILCLLCQASRWPALDRVPSARRAWASPGWVSLLQPPPGSRSGHVS